jgi:hypothetical protein
MINSWYISLVYKNASQPDRGEIVQLDLGHAILTVLDEHVVLVETKAGVTRDRHMTRQLYEEVEQMLPGEYSLVVNRKNEYVMWCVETYDETNGRERLRGIAIVTYQAINALMIEYEAKLCQKPFKNFNRVDEAVSWAKSLHATQQRYQ